MRLFISVVKARLSTLFPATLCGILKCRLRFAADNSAGWADNAHMKCKTQSRVRSRLMRSLVDTQVTNYHISPRYAKIIVFCCRLLSLHNSPAVVTNLFFKLSSYPMSISVGMFNAGSANCSRDILNSRSFKFIAL